MIIQVCYMYILMQVCNQVINVKHDIIIGLIFLGMLHMVKCYFILWTHKAVYIMQYTNCCW